MVENPYESPAEVADETREPRPRRHLTWRDQMLRTAGISGVLLLVLILIPERMSNPPELRPNDIDLLRIGIGMALLVTMSIMLVSGIYWMLNEDSQD